jgi:hypothetical protein
MQSQRNTVIAIVAIVAVTGLIAFYIWSSHARYYIVVTSKGAAYEVDRRTGDTWELRGSRKIPHSNSEEIQSKEKQAEEKKSEELPQADAIKITGEADLEDVGYMTVTGTSLSGDFGGKLYNGSDWVVTKLLFNVTAKEASGNVRWSHDYIWEGYPIDPLEAFYFDFPVTEYKGVTKTTWSIRKAYGFKR